MANEHSFPWPLHLLAKTSRPAIKASAKTNDVSTQLYDHTADRKQGAEPGSNLDLPRGTKSSTIPFPCDAPTRIG